MFHTASTAQPAISHTSVRPALTAAKSWLLRVVADFNRYADASAKVFPAQADTDSTGFSL